MSIRAMTPTQGILLPYRRFRSLGAWIKNVLWHIRVMYDGWKVFSKTGQTPPAALHHMISLFCATRGVSNEICHALVKRRYRRYPMTHYPSQLGNFTQSQIESYAAQIRRDGYLIFPTRFSESFANRLQVIARTTPAHPDSFKGEPRVYDGANPISARYMVFEKNLMNQSDVQTVVSDPFFWGVAQAYLGLPPILDIVIMACSPTFRSEASSPSAQMYHFDLDRFRWLKFFIYLNDVTPENGPHCFIKGSHRAFSIPSAIMKKHYARLPDEEVARYYPPESFIEIIGKKGTVCAVDTRGLHKGKLPQKGERFLMQLEFSDILYGAAYERTPVKPIPGGPLAMAAEKYPRIFSKFNFQL